MEICKTIGGYKIHIYDGGTLCKVTRGDALIFAGVINEGVTAEQVYYWIIKETMSK